MKCPICGKFVFIDVFNMGELTCGHGYTDFAEEIERLKKENIALIKRVSMLEEYDCIQKSHYFGDGTWHEITEEASNLIKKQARIFCGDGKLDPT